MQEITGDEEPKLVPFPVYLALKYDDNLESYPDFILNISEAWIFVRTESPLPEGTSLIMHFYIPPENKLLAEVRGQVITMNQNNEVNQRGMLIKFAYLSRKELSRLERYAEGKKHLIDKKI